VAFDATNFVRNIGLLIGLLLLLGASFVLFVSAWTTISSLIWIRQRRRAEQEHRAKELRPDGKPFPPVAEGVCSQCGRGSRKIYFPPASGRKELCPTCYDTYWRDTETWQEVPTQSNRSHTGRIHLETASGPSIKRSAYPSRTT